MKKTKFLVGKDDCIGGYSEGDTIDCVEVFRQTNCSLIYIPADGVESYHDCGSLSFAHKDDSGFFKTLTNLKDCYVNIANPKELEFLKAKINELKY